MLNKKIHHKNRYQTQQNITETHTTESDATIPQNNRIFVAKYWLHKSAPAASGHTDTMTNFLIVSGSVNNAFQFDIAFVSWVILSAPYVQAFICSSDIWYWFIYTARCILVSIIVTEATNSRISYKDALKSCAIDWLVVGIFVLDVELIDGVVVGSFDDDSVGISLGLIDIFTVTAVGFIVSDVVGIFVR